MATKKSDKTTRNASCGKSALYDKYSAFVKKIDGEVSELAKLVVQAGAGDLARDLKQHWGVTRKSLMEYGNRMTKVRCAVAMADTAKPAKKPAAAKLPKPAKVAKITKAEADAAKPNVPQAAKDPAAFPASVRITDKEVELHLGSFGVRQLAEHDASELLGHPMVFWYRRGVFPDPRQSRVNPTVISAKPVERKGKAFTAAPWTVHVKIGMAGDAVHCLAWARGVYSRNKGEQE